MIHVGAGNEGLPLKALLTSFKDDETCRDKILEFARFLVSKKLESMEYRVELFVWSYV